MSDHFVDADGAAVAGTALPVARAARPGTPVARAALTGTPVS